MTSFIETGIPACLVGAGALLPYQETQDSGAFTRKSQ
jgi:hypothetical protein